MSNNYPFPIYTGVLEPKHYKQIGTAIWLFLWCISSTTKDVERDGVTWGLVLGNKPVKVDTLEPIFGVTERTIREWINKLEKHGYIKVTRAPYGLIFTVRNSKKYARDSEENNRSGTEENFRSMGSDRKFSSDHSEENFRSNKDIIKILIDRLIDDLEDERLTSRCGVLTTVISKEVHLDEAIILQRVSQIEKYFNQRKGRLNSAASDWVPMNQVAKQAIPLEFILFGIDLAFARHDKTKQWPTDSIGNFAYCEKTIVGSWNRLRTEIKQMDTMDTKTVDSSSGKQSKGSRQQEQFSLLERLAEEERRNEQGRSD